MKFKAEDLLQIFLDGSFTPEAQTEFDRLVSQDPLFAERVTKALSERLGPVPDSTVEAIAANLDGKIGGLWEKNKPSPFSRSLRLPIRIALALAAAGGLYFGFKYWAGPLIHSFGPVPAGSIPQALNAHPAAVLKKPRSISFSISAKGINAASPSAKKNPDLTSRESGTAQTSTASSGELNSPPVSARDSAALTLPAASFSRDVPLAGTTMEGDSLTVDIETDSAQKITVTVYDANGLPVRHLFSGVLEAGEHSLDWDGKDDSGNVLSPGNYAVILDRGGQKMSGLLKLLPSR